jgi:hypothetical protein
MVGWSGRNRASRERHERWLKWYWSLTDEKRAEVDRRHREEWERTKMWLAFAIVAVGAAMMSASAWLSCSAPSP